MISLNTLAALSTIPIPEIDKAVIKTLPRVSGELPKERRIVQYIEDCVNPYCFRAGDNFVKTQFSANGPALQDALVKSATGKNARHGV